MQGFIWLAEKGNADADYILGCMYYDARLSEKELNSKKRTKFEKKNIFFPESDKHTFRTWSCTICTGRSIPDRRWRKKDIHKALGISERASNAGTARGYVQLCAEYLFGRNVPVDFVKARYFNEKAANLGDTESLAFWLDWDLAIRYSKEIRETNIPNRLN